MINITQAIESDLTKWMLLVDKVRWNFPGLESDEQLEDYRNVVIKNMKRGTALCAKDNEMIVGILIFSIKQKRLGCMAVDPEYRRQEIASKLIENMLSFFRKGDEISVSTFREDDLKGIAPRSLYKKLGFAEAEFIIEFNYPNQMFRLQM